MDLASYQHLKLERQPGGVMLITLNRPDVLNAAHEGMHAELASIWADLSQDDETRVAVVTGPAGRSRPAAISAWSSGRSATTTWSRTCSGR